MRRDDEVETEERARQNEHNFLEAAPSDLRLPPLWQRRRGMTALFADPSVMSFKAPDRAPVLDRGFGLVAEQAQLRLLVADDDEIVREVVLLLLGRLDHRADFAGNGVEALAAVRAAPYDVVLMDIHMPQMNGLEATRRIRSECSETLQPAIIAMTAGVTVEDQVHFLRTGMDDVLTKPVRLNELAVVLGSYGSNAHMI